MLPMRHSTTSTFSGNGVPTSFEYISARILFLKVLCDIPAFMQPFDIDVQHWDLTSIATFSAAPVTQAP